jgi:hypothetical protein
LFEEPQAVNNNVENQARLVSSELETVQSAISTGRAESAPVSGLDPVTEKKQSLYEPSSLPPSLAHNVSPPYVVMQRHVMRYWNIRPTATTGSDSNANLGGSTAGLDVDAVMSIDQLQESRPAAERGEIELLSERLIRAAADGKINEIDELLDDERVSPDVADCTGVTPLLAASVRIDIYAFLRTSLANFNY